MTDDCAVTPETCELHRALINEKIKSTDKRVEGMEKTLTEIRDFQRNTFWAIIVVCVITILILIGVILGRGFDFGLIAGVL